MNMIRTETGRPQVLYLLLFTAIWPSVSGYDGCIGNCTTTCLEVQVAIYGVIPTLSVIILLMGILLGFQCLRNKRRSRMKVRRKKSRNEMTEELQEQRKEDTPVENTNDAFDEVENSTNEDQSKGAGEDNSGYMLVNQLQLHNRSVRFEGSNTLPLTRIRSHDSELHSVGIDCDQTSQTRKISLPQPFPYAPKTSLTLDRLCFVDESRANSYLASQKARNNLTRSMKEDCRYGTTGEPVYMNVSKPQRNPDIQMSSSHQEAYVAMGLPYFK